VAIALVLVIVAGFGLLGIGGVTEVKDNEVAVIVNYVTGKITVDPIPGNKVVIPFIEEINTLDKSPNRFLMEGEEDLSTDHVQKLTVRASDGSNFWFDQIEIQYELIPDAANKVVQDSGVGEAFKKFWLLSFARSILRDEFGKFDPEGLSNPQNYKAAQDKAETRLNKALEPHGIRIVQITTPKPKFADAYERAIEERKLADQDVERLKAKALQLTQEKAKKLAVIESEKGQEFAALKGKLEAELAMAQAERVKLEREADAYKIERGGEGEAERLSKTEEARGLEEKYQKEAEGLLARAEALAKQGRMAVVEALAEKLADVRIEILPYQRSQAPTRIEVTQEAAAPVEAPAALGGTTAPTGKGR
jgi:membrane protease subunit HflC